jgi:hypothetical protein
LLNTPALRRCPLGRSLGDSGSGTASGEKRDWNAVGEQLPPSQQNTETAEFEIRAGGCLP